MRHRLSVNLYDEHPLEAEVLDYLADCDRRKRQETHRLLLLAGFNALVRGRPPEAAVLEAADPRLVDGILQAMTALGMRYGASGVAPAPAAPPPEGHHAPRHPVPPGQRSRARERPPAEADDLDPALLQPMEPYTPKPTAAAPSRAEAPREDEDDELEDPLAKLRRMS